MNFRVAFSFWLAIASLASGAGIEKLLSDDEAAAANRLVLGDKAPLAPAILRWRNGETLKGEFADATAEEVRWNSPLFEGPLALAWTAVRRVDRPLAPVAVSEPFAVILRNGSFLYGDLAGVTDEAISLRRARHGAVILKRAEVLAVRRIRGGKLLAAGPLGDTEWRTATGVKKNGARILNGMLQPAMLESSSAPTVLQSGPGGALVLPDWNRGAALDLKFPDLVDLEFRVRSSTRPDFQISLEAEGKQRLRVETWDEDLVLTAADGFKAIQKIAEADRTVALRICWDRKARQCSVFTPRGEKIAEWEVPDDASGASGRLVLQGKGRDLALEFLRVREWDGKPPAKLAGNLPRVELADGRVVEGQFGAGPDGTISVDASAPDSDANYSLAEVDALVFSDDPPATQDRDAVLTFADGAVLRGRIDSIKDGSVALVTPFTAEPLPALLRGLRQLLLAPLDSENEAPLAELDTLTLDGTKLHGHFAATGDARPRWLPVGGVAPALMSATANCEISRAQKPGAAPLNAPALFFTTGGDVLPGTLRSLDRSGVEIASDLFAATHLPAGNLSAIFFGTASSSGVQGFADRGWQILHGKEKSVIKTADSVKLPPETALGHASVMQSSEITFSVTADQGFGGARLRLFSAGEERGDTLNLIIANMGGRVYYGAESADGQMNDELQQTSLGATGTMAVRLLIDDQRVELSINGVTLRSFAVPLEKRKGMGLVIKPGNVFGNEERPITLADFSAKSVPGRIWMPEVNAETRTQALTIPRFRRDDPPIHALLAANGDVLRGEIEAATTTHFGFRSGLENLRVPRDRVKAAIWLQKPDPVAPPVAAKPPTLEALGQKLTRRTRYTNSGLTAMIEALRREAPGLKFKLPSPIDVSRRATMQFGTQTIGQALDEICGLFNLRYRVDDDGTIVIEDAPAPAKDFVEKVYWLKPGALPGDGSAQDLLAGKGVPFPAKSSAQWQASAGQLTVTNTAANQDKLAVILAAEFGGSLGSPTHWLVLTNGARFGLAVEKFSMDSIAGRHPIYGHCEVPLAQVLAIRTAPPEPAPAMKSLAGWRLAYAPEPMLPETGGESSPTIGKPAKTFKLPLLGGGDFDLANEKGKVVVLDFWATWCGPCVKSLPALIEAMSAFPADRVKLVGLNQSEPREDVKRFLDTRGWKLTVALDAGQSVARQFGVEGIPHTVIVGPDGNVSWVKTGYSPDGATEAAHAVEKLLAAPAK